MTTTVDGSAALMRGRTSIPASPGILVQHDEVDLVTFQHLERLGAVRRFEDVAGLFEDRSHRGAHTLLVVHDEDRASQRRSGARAGHRGRARSIVRYWLAPPLPPPARCT